MANQPDLFTRPDTSIPRNPAEIRRRLCEPLGDPTLQGKPPSYCRGVNQVRFRELLQQGRTAR